MVHAYAIDPAVLPNWAHRHNYRFIVPSFGLGSPRIWLEFPNITEWTHMVDAAGDAQGLSTGDQARLTELIVLLQEACARRPNARYNDAQPWLDNAEAEYARRPFAAIISTTNPRRFNSVITDAELGTDDPRWAKPTAQVPNQTPGELARVLADLLENSTEVHFVDPHFGLENARYRDSFEPLLGKCTNCTSIVVHCKAGPDKQFFENEAARFSHRIPHGVEVRFKRWAEKTGGERIHNRYVLTEIGGVIIGDGVDARPEEGITDDVNLMSRKQQAKRWAQYCGPSPAFDLVDEPRAVIGRRRG